jgi:hypothetical protein
VARASNMKGGYGSKTTLTLDTSPSFDNTLKTPQNPQEDPVSREVSYPRSIPLSPNYFDALFGMEEDAPLEKRALQTEATETQRTSAPRMDPNKKAPMPLEQLEREAKEEALQHALHLSHMEAHRTRLGRSRQTLRSGGEREAAGQPRSRTAGPTTRHAEGSTTLLPPPTPTGSHELIPDSEPSSSAPAS